MIIENVSTLKIHKLTQDQYNRALENGNIDEDALYLTPDDMAYLGAYETIEHSGNTYETKKDSSSKLTEAKEYTDEQVAIAIEHANNLLSGQVLPNANHTHDDRYYIKENIDSMIDDINTTIIELEENQVSKDHNHDDKYDAIGAADVVSGVLSNHIDNKDNPHNVTASQVGAYNKEEIDGKHEDIRKFISELETKLNNFLDVDDETSDQLSEVIAIINENKDIVDEILDGKINTSDIVNNLTTSNEKRVLSASQGVAIKELIDNLSEVVSGKADKNHSHNYASSNEDGVALDSLALGGIQSSLYALKTDIPKGSLANKDIVTESDLDNALVEKVNAASDGNHSHLNKDVLDTITSDKVNAWNEAEANSKEYIDSVLSGKANISHTHDDRYYTETEIDSKISTLNTSISGKAASGHTHDDRYYTESEIDAKLENKSNTGHTHTIANVSGLQSALDNKETNGAAESALANAKSYTDTKIANLINGAPTTLDTLGEIATAMAENEDVVATLDAAIGKKANATHSHAISDVANLQTTLDKKVTTDTEQIITGLKTFNAPANISLTEQITTKLKTSNGGAIIFGKEGPNSGTMIRLDQTDGTARLRFRASDTAGAMVWEQPEQGAQLYVDLGKDGVDKHRVTFPSSAGTLALQSEIVNHSSNKGNPHGVTASQIGAYNKEEIDTKIDAINTSISGKASSTHEHDGRYYTETEVDGMISDLNTKISGKANSSHGNHVPTTQTASNKVFLRNDNTWATITPANIGAASSSHNHTVSNITDLTVTATELNYIDGVTSNVQAQLDSKAASSHGTHVTYSSTAPVMDGTASVGTASTVARSDHKHPTDTSRAAKSDFDSHVANTTAHITSTERSNWNSAKSHADSAHAPSNAQPNQNAFSNIAVSGQTTVTADTTTDTVTFVGSNISITTDATNDKVTFSVPDGSTGTKGVVQLTNSISSTSTTTAATPNSVKSAYDLANSAKGRADDAYALAESKASSSHGIHVPSCSTTNNGQFLTVVNGSPAWTTVTNLAEVKF